MWSDQQVVERVSDIIKRSRVDRAEFLIERLESIKNHRVALSHHLEENHQCKCPGIGLLGVLESLERQDKYISALEAVARASELIDRRGGTSNDYVGLRAALMNLSRHQRWGEARERGLGE